MGVNRSLAPTRSNMMKVSEDLKFAQLGHDLLDQKRSILVVELLTLVDQAVDYESRVNMALKEAQSSLAESIMHMGRLKVANLAGAVNIDYSIEVGSRKVMGVHLPKVDTTFNDHAPYFSSEGTAFVSEITIGKYRQALELMGRLAELKVSIMRLAREVKKTIRKVNALEKIVIPDDKETIRFMRERIEEQERDQFTLMKTVKDHLNVEKTDSSATRICAKVMQGGSDGISL